MPVHFDAHTCPYCTGRDGRPKRLYASHAEAEDTAAHRQGADGVQLRVYRREHLDGCHLTKQPDRGW